MKKPNRYPYSKSKFKGRVYSLLSARFKAENYIDDLKNSGIPYQLTKEDWSTYVFVKIDNLNQLQKLIDVTGENLILMKDEIWIYDGYME